MHQNENRSAINQTWKVRRARIIKFTSDPMNAKGTDIAIKDLMLAYERLELELYSAV